MNMRSVWKAMSMVAIVLLTVFLLAQCSDDDPVKKQMYEINEVNASGISGIATFTKVNSTTTRVTLMLSGTVGGDTHPSHIHNGSVASPGSIAIDLTSVDGATGLSETMVTQLNDGTPITYEELLEFNGYINVHESPTTLATLMAQGNIGANY